MEMDTDLSQAPAGEKVPSLSVTLGDLRSRASVPRLSEEFPVEGIKEGVCQRRGGPDSQTAEV